MNFQIFSKKTKSVQHFEKIRKVAMILEKLVKIWRNVENLIETIESFIKKILKFLDKIFENLNFVIAIKAHAGCGVGCFQIFANFSGFQKGKRSSRSLATPLGF